MWALANNDIKYPEYPYTNWVRGEMYECIPKGDKLVLADERGCHFFFTGEARKRLTEVFTFLEECPECGGSGFSKPGTGYDAVCDYCGGQKVVPV